MQFVCRSGRICSGAKRILNSWTKGTFLLFTIVFGWLVCSTALGLSELYKCTFSWTAMCEVSDQEWPSFSNEVDIHGRWWKMLGIEWYQVAGLGSPLGTHISIPTQKNNADHPFRCRTLPPLRSHLLVSTFLSRKRLDHLQLQTGLSWLPQMVLLLFHPLHSTGTLPYSPYYRNPYAFPFMHHQLPAQPLINNFHTAFPHAPCPQTPATLQDNSTSVTGCKAQ